MIDWKLFGKIWLGIIAILALIALFVWAISWLGVWVILVPFGLVIVGLTLAMASVDGDEF